MSIQDVPNPVIPPPPPPKPRGTMKLVVIVIAVVIIVAVVGVIVLETHKGGTNNTSQNLKVAIVAGSTVNSLAGTKLNETIQTFSTSSTYTIVKATEVIFNKTVNGNISGTMLMISAQFASSAQAISYYNQIYKNTSSEVKAYTNVTIINATYNGFSYYIFSATSGYEYVEVVIGHNGAYLFGIVDLNVYISNFNTLIEDQINVM